MKPYLILLFTFSLLASDKKAEKFVDKYQKTQRQMRHITDDWVAYCKSKAMIPDITLGCIIPPKKEESKKEEKK